MQQYNEDAILTNVAHRYADSLRAIRNDDTSTPKTDEERLDDLRSNRIVLREQACHRPVVRIWRPLEVNRSHRRRRRVRRDAVNIPSARLL